MGKVRVFGTTLIALLALSVIAAPMTVAKGRPLGAELTGANEIPGPGDPDGTGTARLRLNQGRERICYRLTVAEIADPSAAHIHAGDAQPHPHHYPDPDPGLYEHTGCPADRRIGGDELSRRSGQGI